MNEFKEYIEIMKGKFAEAVEESKSENSEAVKDAAKGFTKTLTKLILAKDEEQIAQAHDLLTMYESILLDYRAIETIRFTSVLMEGIGIGLGIALKIAIALLQSIK